MLAVLAVTASAHAMGMAQMDSAAPHQMAMGEPGGAEMGCCAQAGTKAGHDLLCEVACAATLALPDRPSAQVKAARLFASFPSLTTVLWSGRTPTLPERPPKHGFPTV